MKILPLAQIRTTIKVGALALIVGLCLNGCGLIPKKVEFFQKDVPEYPSKTPAQIQAERQAAARLVDKTRETELAAAAEDASEFVRKPASEASGLAEGLSLSLGPPTTPWRGESEALVARLEALEARRAVRLDKLEDKLSKLEGKPIEGTGKLQVPYLVWLGIVGGGSLLLFLLIKLGLSIAATFNPAAAIANAGLDIPVKGFAQLVKAGGKFHEFLDKQNIPAEIKETVRDLWFRAQKEAQSPEVQAWVKKLPGARTQ